jgi:hypothetical protein
MLPWRYLPERDGCVRETTRLVVPCFQQTSPRAARTPGLLSRRQLAPTRVLDGKPSFHGYQARFRPLLTPNVRDRMALNGCSRPSSEEFLGRGRPVGFHPSELCCPAQRRQHSRRARVVLWMKSMAGSLTQRRRRRRPILGPVLHDPQSRACPRHCRSFSLAAFGQICPLRWAYAACCDAI